MTHIATQGTSSCACISIGGFKQYNQKLNEEYKKTGKWEEDEEKEITTRNTTTKHYQVDNFFYQVLFPISQPLGRTQDVPFEYLMEKISEGSLKTKLVTCVLNYGQFINDDNYWPRELSRWGFKLVEKTRNSMGGAINYLFTRNPSKVEINETEKVFTNG